MNIESEHTDESIKEGTEKDTEEDRKRQRKRHRNTIAFRNVTTITVDIKPKLFKTTI